jgi:predicted dehydrogenase
VKELLAAGTIGDVRSVDFHWYLDTDHGADYFRRWHRRMEQSGGLFVHKATHHFDLVNWWLDDHPAQVCAAGRLAFYGPTRAERGERCLTCAHTATCEFAWDLTADDDYRRLYLEQEAGDGYHRDGCVFDPEIDIYDTMSAIVRYERGAQMTYSLNAYAAYEGMRASFNGSTGRLEIEVIESRHQAADEIRVYRFLTEAPESVTVVPRIAQDHGGGDERLRDRLFRGAGEDDPLGHAAGVMDGAYSVLVGVAANRSVQTGGWVRIEDLLGAPT